MEELYQLQVPLVYCNIQEMVPAQSTLLLPHSDEISYYLAVYIVESLAEIQTEVVSLVRFIFG